MTNLSFCASLSFFLTIHSPTTLGLRLPVANLKTCRELLLQLLFDILEVPILPVICVFVICFSSTRSWQLFRHFKLFNPHLSLFCNFIVHLTAFVWPRKILVDHANNLDFRLKRFADQEIFQLFPNFHSSRALSTVRAASPRRSFNFALDSLIQAPPSEFGRVHVGITSYNPEASCVGHSFQHRDHECFIPHIPPFAVPEIDREIVYTLLAFYPLLCHSAFIAL